MIGWKSLGLFAVAAGWILGYGLGRWVQARLDP